MKLTGKAKAKFEEWYNSDSVPMTYPHFDRFCMLPEAAQWGIIQDWADSLMIDVNVEGYDLQKEFDCVIKQGATSNGSTFITRQEARNAAIEKLNELINEG